MLNRINLCRVVVFTFYFLVKDLAPWSGRHEKSMKCRKRLIVENLMMLGHRTGWHLSKKAMKE
jgi:hypothetical protein